MELRDQLTDAERRLIRHCGLLCVLELPRFQMNRGLITVVTERWHSETNTFWLPQGEMTITLEDVYRLLQILTHGEIVYYDTVYDGTYCR